ncbi:helix-turn-helix domain-containing protein [Qipengyuania citrea]
MKGPISMPSAGTTDHLREQRQRQSIEPIAMRVPEACRYLGIGRSTLYVLIGKGEIEVIKLGSSTLVLTASLRALVERRQKPAEDELEVAGK